MASPSNFDKALSALNAELENIGRWYRAPHFAQMRHTENKGNLDTDYQRLEGKLQDLRAVLPNARLADFDACVQQIKMTFGAMIIHANFPYDNQLDVSQGWPIIWQKLDNSLKGLNVFLGRLAEDGGGAGRAHGAGGPRIDLFGIDRGCA